MVIHQFSYNCIKTVSIIAIIAVNITVNAYQSNYIPTYDGCIYEYTATY